MNEEPLARPDEHPLLKEAVTFLQMGYFSGAIKRCEEFARLGPKHELAGSFVAWLARVYEGGDQIPTMLERFPVEIAKSLTGGQGLAETALVVAMHERRAELAGVLSSVTGVLDKQHGVLVAHHPTALLALAGIALDEAADSGTARRLCSCALGLRGVYVSLKDTEKLADLLIALEAPVALWADWVEIFIGHITFSACRPRIFATEFEDPEAVEWATRQDAESEGVFERALARGPTELVEMIERLAPQLDAPGLAEIVREREILKPESTPSGPPAADWCSVRNLRSRYFWHDMVLEHEQHFLRNGDWALFFAPTPDFSMAVAQWWRLLEAVLKRVVVEPLSTLFADNPDWLIWDQEHLSPAAQKKESVLIDKLADVQRARRMTLSDMLMVLEKCVANPKSPRHGSKLRQEATRFFGDYRRQFEGLVQSSWLCPKLLTSDNINWYRNRASHDGSVDLVDASIGRVLARRLISHFFLPVLKDWGFVPTLPLHIQVDADRNR